MTSDRNSGLLSELEKLTRALGAWSERLAVGGGVALIVYDQCIAHASASPVGTTDLDFLIQRDPGVGSTELLKHSPIWR